jgi:uncharacterized membrane protein YkoI
MKLKIWPMIVFGLAAAPAMAADCKLDGKTPMPIEEMIKLVQGRGFKDITSIELEKGCYEIRAKDEKENRVKMELNAADGAIVELERERAVERLLR